MNTINPRVWAWKTACVTIGALALTPLALAGSVSITSITQEARAYGRWPFAEDISDTLTAAGTASASLTADGRPLQPSASAEQRFVEAHAAGIRFTGAAHGESQITNWWPYVDDIRAASTLVIDFEVTGEAVRFHHDAGYTVTAENMTIPGISRYFNLSSYTQGSAPVGEGVNSAAWSHVLEPGDYYFQFSVSAGPGSSYDGTNLGLVSFSDVTYTTDTYFTKPDGSPLTGGGIDFSQAAAFPVGDYNGSGQVEQGDLDLVLQNWGLDTDTTGVPSGWLNDLPSGQIEQTELDGVLQNWGSTSVPDFGGATDVPEPATAALVAIVVMARRRIR